MASANGLPRKPATRAAARTPLPAVRRRIFDEACELVTAGETRDLVAALAKRFNVSERSVHLALIAEGMRHQRRAAVLATGILNALSMARDAEIAIEEDLSSVA